MHRTPAESSRDENLSCFVGHLEVILMHLKQFGGTLESLMSDDLQADIQLSEIEALLAED